MNSSSSNATVHLDWRPTTPNLPSSNDPVYRAFHSVPSGIYPNNTALLCRSPTPPPPGIRTHSMPTLQRLGLTYWEAYWLFTNDYTSGSFPLSELPFPERAHADCAVCMQQDLCTATFLCGFHFCLLVSAHTSADLEVLTGLTTVDPVYGGIRCRADPFNLLARWTRSGLVRATSGR